MWFPGVSCLKEIRLAREGYDLFFRINNKGKKENFLGKQLTRKKVASCIKMLITVLFIILKKSRINENRYIGIVVI